MARALTFTVLVLSNLCLIHANRSWGRSAWLGGDTSNRQFGWIALATVVLLVCVLGVPAISQLFYSYHRHPSCCLWGWVRQSFP